MADWTHRHARINGIHMHWAEQGEGMPVILCHGFPHLWFSWRHQIPVIAELVRGRFGAVFEHRS